MILLPVLAILTQHAKIDWEKDHAASLQRAQEFRRPLLAYFRAST